MITMMMTTHVIMTMITLVIMMMITTPMIMLIARKVQQHHPQHRAQRLTVSMSIIPMIMDFVDQI